MTKLKDKNQDASDSDSSHIEPSQFRSPKQMNNSSRKSPQTSERKSKVSHEISSSSDEEVMSQSSTGKKKSPKKKKSASISVTSSDSDVASETLSKKRMQSKKKTVNRKSQKSKFAVKKTKSKSNILTSDSETESKTERTHSDTSVVAAESTTDLSDIHNLQEEDPDDCELWLIKMPAKLPLSSLPTRVVINGIQDFSNNKKHYELVTFADEFVQRDHMSLVQGVSNKLVEGPSIRGQMHVVAKPSEPVQPVTTPLITQNPVPFPSGLKVRFTPFGADEPAMISNHKSKKHKKRRLTENQDTTQDSVEDTDFTPKKKKKKKKKKL